jgi:hypothetical protein
MSPSSLEAASISRPETPGLASSSGCAALEVGYDYSTSQKLGNIAIVINGAAGNEPNLLGMQEAEGLIRDGLGEASIIMPVRPENLDAQRRIVSEESACPDRVHFNVTHARILQGLLDSQGDYAAHLREIRMHRSMRQRELDQLYGGEFEARSATTDQTVIHDPSMIVSLEAGSRVVVGPAQSKNFVFPVRLSDLLEATLAEHALGVRFSKSGADDAEFNLASDMKFVMRTMRTVEAQYSNTFIPRINTLASRYLSSEVVGSSDSAEHWAARTYAQLLKQPLAVDEKLITYTPAMKPEMLARDYEGVSEQGVYVIFSGLANSSRQAKIIAAAQEAGYTVYYPPWAEEDIEGAYRLSPKVRVDKRIKAIFGRMGWGTGWDAQQSSKPFIVAPYESGDDPEIYFNNQVVRLLGKVIDFEDFSGAQLQEDIELITPRIRALNGQIADEFGSTDGIKYIAGRIINSL